MKRTITTIGDFRIHATHAGSGPDVVLLHGLAGSGRWWRYTVPALAPHFTTHAPDLIGFGRTRGMPPAIAEMAELLARWIESAGIKTAHVLGHSMGGQLAIHLAANHARVVRKLVLVDAAGVPPALSFLRATRLVAELVPPHAWGSARFLPTIAADVLRAGPRVFARATRNLLQDDVRPLLPRIGAPTLIIWGALDALTPLRDGEYMAQHIAGADLQVYPDAAHMPMVDSPQRFNREVLAFLSHD